MLWCATKSFSRTQVLTPPAVWSAGYWGLTTLSLPGITLEGSCLNRNHALGGRVDHRQNPIFKSPLPENPIDNGGLQLRAQSCHDIFIHIHMWDFFPRNVLGCIYPQYLISVKFCSITSLEICFCISLPTLIIIHLSPNTVLRKTLVKVEKQKFRFLVNLQFTK